MFAQVPGAKHQAGYVAASERGFVRGQRGRRGAGAPAAHQVRRHLPTFPFRPLPSRHSWGFLCRIPCLGAGTSCVRLKSYRTRVQKSCRAFAPCVPSLNLGFVPPGYHMVTMVTSDSPICTLFLPLSRQPALWAPSNVPRFDEGSSQAQARVTCKSGGFSPPWYKPCTKER